MNHEHGFAPIIIVITILIIGSLAGAFYWGKQTNKPPTQTPALSPSSTIQPTSLPQNPASSPSTQATIPPTITSNPNLTTDWKMYINSKYGYSIQYPSSWKVSDSDDGKDINNGDLEQLLILSDPSNGKNSFSIRIGIIGFPLADLYFHWSKFMVSKTLENTTIRSMSAKKAVLWHPLTEDTFSIEYAFDYNNLRWYISFPSKDKLGNHEDIFDQILATFKFD